MTLRDLREAQEGLAGVAVRTRLVEAPLPQGGSVWLKCELEQPVGAFKLRGAYTALRRLDPAERARGVVTHSSGNHGRAVAWAAKQFGMRAVIVMPADAPEVKIAGVRAEGGEVVFVQDRSERSPTAERLEREQGLISIPPYEHPDVVAGQGTVGLEILEQLPAVQEILVPVGGGGLLAGICAAVSGLAPEVKVTGVEPEGAAKLSAALAAQRPVSVGEPKSIADGLLPPRLGEIPWSCVSGVVSRAVTVSDESIGVAVRYLHEVAGLRVEPSGATTVAALLSGVEVRAPVVAVLSGGNVDPALFQRLVA